MTQRALVLLLTLCAPPASPRRSLARPSRVAATAARCMWITHVHPRQRPLLHVCRRAIEQILDLYSR